MIFTNELVGQMDAASLFVLLTVFLGGSAQAGIQLGQSLLPCLLWDQMESHPPVSFSTYCVSFC